MSAEISHALLTDLYEFTMVDAYRRADMAHRPATFSLFVRTLPSGRGYLVAAGLDDALAWLENLRFEQGELAALDRLGIFSDDFLDWLTHLRFTGTVRAVPEGTIVFANEPILEVDAPIAEAQLAETFLLNQITLQTVLATKAARCRHAADGRTVVDFASRRSQSIDAAMKLSRICRLVGVDATSNVAGAHRYGVAAVWSPSGAFTLFVMHACERGIIAHGVPPGTLLESASVATSRHERDGNGTAFSLCRSRLAGSVAGIRFAL